MKPTIAPALALSAALALVALAAGGCSSRQSAPVTMAPPISAPADASAQNGGVFQWQDVPQGQQIPITRAVFDQGGYQLYAQSGETILVPFANQNLYVMKFGIASGPMYFVQDGSTPTLFVPRGTGLENASAQGARWYPFSQDYDYQRPVYVGIAPSWNAYTSMGWYPGMSYYGGYWGSRPGIFTPMTGIVFNIGGTRYNGWNSYSNYYRSNPGYTRPTRTYNYASTGRQSPSSFGRNRGTGSFGSSAGRSSGTYSNSRPSFGSGNTRSSGGSTGSFGRTRSGGGLFGGGSSTSSRPSSGSSGFGTTRRSGSGSFGTSSGSSGYRSSGGRSSSGSFGSSSGRSSSSGGSFGRSSSGRSSGGSFGRSSGGSFGGRRR